MSARLPPWACTSVGDPAVQPPSSYSLPTLPPRPFPPSLAVPIVQGLPRIVQCVCMRVVCVYVRVPVYLSGTFIPCQHGAFSHFFRLFSTFGLMHQNVVT